MHKAQGNKAIYKLLFLKMKMKITSLMSNPSHHFLSRPNGISTYLYVYQRKEFKFEIALVAISTKTTTTTLQNGDGAGDGNGSGFSLV